MRNTLIHAPLACSLAARIAAAEGGVPLEIRYVSLRTKTFEDGSDFYAVNPLGQVSVLQLENGELITETSAVLVWIQSHATNSAFRRTPEAPDYFQMIRWLGFCATELHKQIFRVVFYTEADDETKNRIRALAPQRFALLDAHLREREFLVGETYSAVDAYLTWFFVLSDYADVNPSGFAYLNAYRERVLARPVVSELIENDRQKSKEVASLRPRLLD